MMKRMLPATLAIGALTGAFLLPADSVEARDLRIAVEASTATMDPHEYNNSPNLQVYLNVFETLVGVSADGESVPRLATEVTPISDTEWLVRLREGVKFHDGDTLDADDVIASIERARNGKGPSTFASRVAAITEVRKVDDLTLHLVTEQPYPVLGLDLQFVFIVPAGVSEATVAEFDNGAAAIGTGQYRFVSYTPGEQVTLERFDDYWGGRPDWDRVIYRVIPDASAREVALLAGDIDLMEKPSTINIGRLESEPGARVWRKAGDRTTFIGFSLRPEAHDVQGLDGRNPFADAAVREAVSIAINRDLLIERILNGAAAPASQMLPPGNFGHNPEITVAEFDRDRARELFEGAGLQDARVTLWVANERVVDARRLGPALATMLSQAGLETSVEVLPYTVWLPAAREGEYSLFLNSYRSSVPDAGGALRAIFADASGGTGFGSQNYSGVPNPEATEAVIATNRELDVSARESALQEAMAQVLGDRIVVPLFWEANTWVSAPGVVYEARTDARTSAIFARPE